MHFAGPPPFRSSSAMAMRRRLPTFCFKARQTKQAFEKINGSDFKSLKSRPCKYNQSIMTVYTYLDLYRYMYMVASTCFLFSSVFISILGEGKTHLMFPAMCQLSLHRTLSRFDRGFDLPANGCENTAMPRSMVTWLTWWRHKKKEKTDQKGNGFGWLRNIWVGCFLGVESGYASFND